MVGIRIVRRTGTENDEQHQLMLPDRKSPGRTEGQAWWLRGCIPPYNFRDSGRRACGESNSAFRAAQLGGIDAEQFCRGNLVTAVRAERVK
jgi:hypothetical protein